MLVHGKLYPSRELFQPFSRLITIRHVCASLSLEEMFHADAALHAIHGPTSPSITHGLDRAYKMYVTDLHTASFYSQSIQRTISVARHGLLYHADYPRPRLVLLPIRPEYDPDCGCKPWPEDFNTDAWFDATPVMSSINYFPGTTCHLKNGYDIFVLPRRVRQDTVPKANKSIDRLFSLQWPGNLVVIKRGFRECGSALHITQSEISLINSLTQRLVGTGRPPESRLTQHWSRWLQMELRVGLVEE